MLFASRIRIRSCQRPLAGLVRHVATLASNPAIKAFPTSSGSGTFLLTYLDRNPPTPELAIGTTTELPPTPRSFTENSRFLTILNEVLAKHAHEVESLKSQAQAMAGSGWLTFRSEGASGQGGAGGGGKGGWIHLSDMRNPPDFGRIAWPEDIFGSVFVDSNGEILGDFQSSGTYRIITNEGILGLESYLENKLIQRLREEEEKALMGG